VDFGQREEWMNEWITNDANILRTFPAWMMQYSTVQYSTGIQPRGFEHTVIRSDGSMEYRNWNMKMEQE